MEKKVRIENEGRCSKISDICMLRTVFSIMVVITFIVLLYQLFELFCSCGGRSIVDLLQNWNFSKFLLTTCFSIFTLYLAACQLQKRSDMNCIKALAELRNQLTTGHNRNVHFALSSSNANNAKMYDNTISFDKIPDIDIYNYLGTIELGYQMLKKGLIEEETFFNQFGYRVEDILEGDSKAHKFVQQHIADNEQYYTDLIEVCKKIQKNETN